MRNLSEARKIRTYMCSNQSSFMKHDQEGLLPPSSSLVLIFYTYRVTFINDLQMWHIGHFPERHCENTLCSSESEKWLKWKRR